MFRTLLLNSSKESKKNITQVILNDLKEVTIPMGLRYQDRIKIDMYLNISISAIKRLGPGIAVSILSAINEYKINDTVKNNPVAYRWVKSFREEINKIKKSLKLSGSDYDVNEYINYVIHSKIIKISQSADIIGSLFKKNHVNLHTVINFMNIITKSVNSLNDNDDLPRYDDEHISMLNYLLSEIKLSPIESISEIRQLNFFQVICLKELYANGLRGENLRQFRENKKSKVFFIAEHHELLKYLIQNQHVSPKDAMYEINDLSDDKVKALKKSWAIGLRGDHLRKWNAGDSAVFRRTQAETIFYLINEQKLTAEKAVMEIDQLTNGCCTALQNFYYLGLRGDHFRQRNLMATFCGYDDHAALNALISLTCNQAIRLPVEKALDEISKVRNVSWYIIALDKLYHLGLRPEHLLLYKTAYLGSDENNFTSEHCETLKLLIHEYLLSPEEAIKEISELTKYAAATVKACYLNGLRGSDLRGWKYNGQFDFHHYLTLKSFIRNEGMSVSNALVKLTKMTSYEVFSYHKDRLCELKRKFKQEQWLLVFGLFGAKSSSLSILSADPLFDKSSVNIITEFLRPL